MFDLTGKAALVTGADAGIGRAIAQRFAQAGAKVHVGDINGEADHDGGWVGGICVTGCGG